MVFVEYTKTIKALQISLAGLDNELEDIKYRLNPQTWKGKWRKWLFRAEWEYQYEILEESRSNALTSIRAVEWAYMLESKQYPESLYDTLQH